jgi:FtsP/CotA-like multicopper oxidase with cupredoxin domain
MDRKTLSRVLMLAAVALVLGSVPALAGHVNVQCPGDVDGDAAWNSSYCAATLAACTTTSDCDPGVPGDTCTPEIQPPGVTCMHLGAGDGFAVMGDDDRTELYTFGFSDLTGIDPEAAPVEGILRAQWPAPTIALDEGTEFYLSLTNVGMLLRPDLFDPHTVHFHGFPQASSVFDGLPESALAINMGATLTYYYKLMNPGTYMYHCHVEATEHMQMGMLGSLYVRPLQNGTEYEYPLGSGATYTKFAYNDGDGSTGYDREFPIQIGSFDSHFHILHIDVQPLPFAEMRDDFPMLNGRGYPDTASPDPMPLPVSISDVIDTSFESTQEVSTLIEANEGDRVLLRLSNLNVTRYYTLASMGIPMHVVGRDAKLLRGPTGIDLSYDTDSVTLGGGESADVMLTAPAHSGAATYDTYFVYTSNLNYLNNGDADPADSGMGGMMTEIHIYPAGTLAPQAVASSGGRTAAQSGRQLALEIE